MSLEEETFRAYTQAQGSNYAVGRPGYSPKLYEIIIGHHTSTGGQLDTVIDVGCGTGQASLDLATYFTHTIGLDPSEGMISAARASAKSANFPIRFEVSDAEALGVDLKPPIADVSVDLLTAATAAHWFDMARFWTSAARVLKPGGTVALWARTGMAVDPIRTLNGVAVKAVVDEIFTNELQTFSKLGSKLTRDLYVDLPLPWTLNPPVEGFDQGSFFRKEWNKYRDGRNNNDLGTGTIVTTEEFENLIGTNSTVTRWREAHPDKVGTEEDIGRKMRKRIESLLHEAGVEPDEEVLTGQVAIVLLMVKKDVA
ncbi:S-adenosyl-L-methionine-dependent methyltransferase [Hypoxylon trugodes]|uniref:S-adenosyl-L-methionine-dependent methyltransferase n=1 Tax=Hypoxylon trugodes TaxID=326681 RepID=UPI00219F5916|nr:S-adenosyl-L-methionine-dependent methyltransferase [Hypoxylon trugodes]KAI1390447.1 S-adenosyl-L-methionine-dependent methyltransferase [Hypoxylon trugodes]